MVFFRALMSPFASVSFEVSALFAAFCFSSSFFNFAICFSLSLFLAVITLHFVIFYDVKILIISKICKYLKLIYTYIYDIFNGLESLVFNPKK